MNVINAAECEEPQLKEMVGCLGIALTTEDKMYTLLAGWIQPHPRSLDSH